MIDVLVRLDRECFFLINEGLQNPFFDWLMPFLRDKYFWIPFYFLFTFLLTFYYKKKIWIVVLMAILTVAISDQLSGQLIKKLVKRPRPCQKTEIKDYVNLKVDCGSGYSFVSSHASNHFALAVFLILLPGRRYKWVIPVSLLWASSISFAQVYLGLHYPLDVMGGAMLGSFIALWTALLTLNFLQRKK